MFGVWGDWFAGVVVGLFFVVLYAYVGVWVGAVWAAGDKSPFFLVL